MQTEEKISIIVPVHNNEKTVEKSVLSVLSPNVEVVLVENNSVDNSYSVCKELARNDDRIVVVQTKERGVSAARNIGLTVASGTIIGFCDADDEYVNGWEAIVKREFVKDRELKVLITRFARNCYDVCCQKSKRHRHRYLFPEEAIKYVMLDYEIMGSVWNKFYRKEVLEGILFNNKLDYCEDTYFNVEVFSKKESNKVLLVDTVTYIYKENIDSATHSTERLFDDNGNLKYIAAVQQVINNVSLTKKCLTYARCAICRLAMSNIMLCFTENQYNKMLYQVKSNFFAEVKHMAFPRLGVNIKRIIRYIEFISHYGL